MGSSDAAGAVARVAAQALAAAGGQMAVLPDAAQQDKAAWCAPFVLQIQPRACLRGQWCCSVERSASVGALAAPVLAAAGRACGRAV